MEIRQEQPADYDAVYQVVKEAFAYAEHSDGGRKFYGGVPEWKRREIEWNDGI